MKEEYLQNPIIGAYFYFPKEITNQQIEEYLKEIKKANANNVWLFVLHVDDEKLNYFLNKAEEIGVKIVPVFMPNISINEHPEVKVVCANGTTSDDPRWANIGCFNHPYLLDESKRLIGDFLRKYGSNPALYKIRGLPLMSFIHEAYYRTDIPEFGGGPLKPCCYCKYCIEDFRKRMVEKYGDINKFNSKHGTSFRDWKDLEPPREPTNPSLWKEWFDYHAEIIPSFLEKLIDYAKSITPLISTHELNDFYPCSYQCVYSGNDIWRMARVIDIGHEDMYPLEFDHRYIIYIYEYIKDILRTAMDFDKIYTANGQAFNSWLGYKVPVESMFEQVYSAIAHGALGIVWWVDWKNLDLWRSTARPNEEFNLIVKALKDYELSRAKVALLYSWTSMELKNDDIYNMDNLLFYTALVRSGFPVDVISEEQILNGVLRERGYKALCTIGTPVLPPHVVSEIKSFIREGGVLITDYSGESIGVFQSVYPELVEKPLTDHIAYVFEEEASRILGLDNKIVPIGNRCEKLKPTSNSKILARFEDGDPAIIQFSDGKGSVVKIGSLIGWDYSNYPGHYDFAVMFPFHIRRNETVRLFISKMLEGFGITPPAESSNPDVEVAVWEGKDESIILAINHLNEYSESEIRVNRRLDGDDFSLSEFISNAPVSFKIENGTVRFRVKLPSFRGMAYLLRRSRRK
ncbi:MAG: beta-galactosidase [Thermoproteota archaeon]